MLHRFYNEPMRSAFTLSAIFVLGLSASAQDLPSARDAAPRSGLAAHAPRDCNQSQLLADGRPIMIPMRNGLAIGISLAQHEFKAAEPIGLHIWVDNRSDVPAGVFTCMDLERFRITGIAIFAQDGHQVLSRDEQKAREECPANPEQATQWGLLVCARNILLRIPSHTCITRDDSDFEFNLMSRFRLPPGKYAIRLQAHWERGIDLCAHDFGEPSPPRPGDLTFTVTNR